MEGGDKSATIMGRGREKSCITSLLFPRIAVLVADSPISPKLLLLLPYHQLTSFSMSFAYFNPYATSAPSRSTFTAAMGSTSAPCLVMFNGLPPDVTEKDLRVSLLIPPKASSLCRALNTTGCLVIRVVACLLDDCQLSPRLGRQVHGDGAGCRQQSRRCRKVKKTVLGS